MGIVIFRPDGSSIRDIDIYGEQYDGSKYQGDLDNWLYFSPDPNRFVWDNYGLITAYCASLYHTSGPARAAVEKPLSYVVGNGLIFRSHIPEKILKVTKPQARKWSRTFSELLHLEKQVSNYYHIQQQLFREAKICGDAILSVYYRTNGDIEFIPISGSRVDWQRGKLGLELNKKDKPYAIYFRDSDKPKNLVNTKGDVKLIHFKCGIRPSQLRGFSAYYSEISQVKNLERGWVAILARWVKESMIIGQQNTETPNDAYHNLKEGIVRKKTVGPSSNEDFEEQNFNLKPGAFFIGKPGDKIEFLKTETPNNNFGLMNEWTIKMFSMSVGYPYEFLMGSYPTSFTAHKGALNDAWKRIKQERFILQETVEEPVNLILLKKFIREGKIEPLGDLNDPLIRQAHLQGNFIGPTLGHINPAQEVQALQTAVEQGFLTRSDAAQMYSNSNFLDMYDEWSYEEKMYYKVADSAPKQQKKVEEDIVVEKDNNDDDDDNQSEGE